MHQRVRSRATHCMMSRSWQPHLPRSKRHRAPMHQYPPHQMLMMRYPSDAGMPVHMCCSSAALFETSRASSGCRRRCFFRCLLFMPQSPVSQVWNVGPLAIQWPMAQHRCSRSRIGMVHFASHSCRNLPQSGTETYWCWVVHHSGCYIQKSAFNLCIQIWTQA